MKQFRDILVYAEIDDADCLSQVVTIAAAHGAAITVCEVLEPPPRIQDSRGIAERVRKLRADRALRRLRSICDRFAELMLIDFAVFAGVPFVVITEKVVEQNFDLVVHISEPIMATSGTGLNATGMHLMRKCPCAVWTLHPEREAGPGSVVLALDREVATGTSAAEAFAINLAETALALAEARAAALHLVHAWRPYGAELLDDSELGLSTADREHYLSQQRKDSELWFKRMVQRIESMAPDSLEVTAHLAQGDALTIVQAVASDVAAGVLVLGTVGTSANPGVLIGPTTESILAACGTSVLAIKPSGFVSPLTFSKSP